MIDISHDPPVLLTAVALAGHLDKGSVDHLSRAGHITLGCQLFMNAGKHDLTKIPFFESA